MTHPMPAACHFHVGLPKTASTFLQQQVFPRLPGVYYGSADPELHHLIMGVCTSNPLFVDVPAARAELEGRFAAAGVQRFLFSWEGLFGGALQHFDRNAAMAEILRGLCPEARIIMVIRRQDELAESLYRQTLHEGFSQPLWRYLNWREGAFQPFERHDFGVFLDPRVLDFAPYVANYERLFGVGNLLLLPFELLAADRSEFLRRLCAFIGVEDVPAQQGPMRTRANRGYSLLSARLALVLNRFFRWYGLGFGGFIPQRPGFERLRQRHDGGALHRLLLDVSERLSLRYLLQQGLDRLWYVKGSLLSIEQRRGIISMHAESNRRLDARFGLGLGRYGYFGDCR